MVQAQHSRFFENFPRLVPLSFLVGLEPSLPLLVEETSEGLAHGLDVLVLVPNGPSDPLLLDDAHEFVPLLVVENFRLLLLKRSFVFLLVDSHFLQEVLN